MRRRMDQVPHALCMSASRNIGRYEVDSEGAYMSLLS